MTPAMPPSLIRCHTFSSVIASYDLESDSQFTKTPATLSRSFSRLLAPRTGWQDQPDRRRHDPHHPAQFLHCGAQRWHEDEDRKSTRLNSSHPSISYAVFCLNKKKKKTRRTHASNKPSSCRDEERTRANV